MGTDVLNSNKILKRRRVLWFCLMVFVMAGIFVFSGQDGETSTEVSSLAERILSVLHIGWLITPGMVHVAGNVAVCVLETWRDCCTDLLCVLGGR